MLLALMSLSSIALLGSFFSFGEDHEDEEPLYEKNSEPNSRYIEGTDGSSDILQDDGDAQVNEEQRSMPVSAETSLKDLSMVNVLEAEPASEQYDNQSMQVIHLMSVSGGIPPLAEWVNNSQLEKVDLADVDSIYVRNPDQLGSLVVLQADYYERIPSNNGDMLHSIHSGANVYFIPDGEEFPEEYQWLESSASLSNTSTFSDQSDDFQGIKLILRIDTGYLHSDNDSEHAGEFKARAFSELQEHFSSDGSLIFGTGQASTRPGN